MGKISDAARRTVVLPIRFYKYFISPLIIPCCRFTPTCSDYAQAAILKHGVIVGSLYSAYRLLRCNPFCRSGYDPVPEESFLSAFNTRRKD